MITTNDVWKAIGTTMRRFRSTPEYFFTEADLVAYLHHTLYGKDKAIQRPGCPPFAKCVHLEYPTCFRYTKARLIEHGEYNPLGQTIGSRGHHDAVVLDPEFVRDTPFVVVVNKDNAASRAHAGSKMEEEEVGGAIALAEQGTTVPTCESLLFAIEAKYVITTSRKFETEVDQDNWKLHWAKQAGAANAVNLVFCNEDVCNRNVLQQVVTDAPDDVVCLFVQSYYAQPGGRFTPKVFTNCQDPSIRALLGT